MARSLGHGDRRRAGDSVLLVGLERPNPPELVLESVRVLGDVLLAGSHGVKLSLAICGVLLRAAGLRVGVACPVTTKVVRENEALVLETLFDVASGTRELCGRSTKLACVRAGGRKAAGYGAAPREEPHLDDFAIPLHDIVSALETWTEGVGANLVDIAT